MSLDSHRDFIILSDSTIEHVANELKAGNGHVLIADPDFYGLPADKMTGKFSLHFFDHPTINQKTGYLSTKRGDKKDGQTGWEKDRQYRLTKKPQTRKLLNSQHSKTYGMQDLNYLYDRADTFFERLDVDQYQFQIAFQSIASMGIEKGKNNRGQEYYIPRDVSPEPAFTHALTWMTNLWKAQVDREQTEEFIFTDEHISSIVKYAVDDLRTGTVFMKNIQAGMDADAFVGLG